MTTVQLTLPDDLAQQAKAAGLLTPEALERMLAAALRRRQAGEELLKVAARIEAAGIPPMTMEEINAEVKAVRAERRKREAGR
jgi:hypothetical protein